MNGPRGTESCLVSSHGSTRVLQNVALAGLYCMTVPFNFNWELWTCWLHLSADLNWVSTTWTLSWIIWASLLIVSEFPSAGQVPNPVNSIQNIKLSPVFLSNTPWRCMGEWRYSSTTLDLGTRCRRVVTITTRPLYPRGKGLRWSLYRRLCGIQSRVRHCGEQKNLLLLSGVEPRLPSPCSDSVIPALAINHSKYNNLVYCHPLLFTLLFVQFASALLFWMPAMCCFTNSFTNHL
jgi:hypothetical protein